MGGNYRYVNENKPRLFPVVGKLQKHAFCPHYALNLFFSGNQVEASCVTYLAKPEAIRFFYQHGEKRSGPTVK